METIKFDSGMQDYSLGQLGTLRFNPADPELYARFLEGAQQLEVMEKKLVEQARQLPGDDPGQAIALLRQADEQLKDLLSGIFGGENDFRKLLAGTNLLAVGSNGQRVITNLLQALQPVLAQGVARCAGQQQAQAVSRAKARRANRE